jgi:hypothetical protein
MSCKIPKGKPARYLLWAIFLTSMGTDLSGGQVLSRRPAQPTHPSPESTPAKPAATSIPLSLPAGTPLKVALNEEVRVKRVGQPVHGKVVEPLYSFDKLVVPAGSEVNGTIAEIHGISKSERTIAAMNANFSPQHEVRINFNELVLADGRHLPLQTIVSPGSGGVLQFVPANTKDHGGKTEEGKKLASRKVSEVRQEIKREWENVKKQIDEPGKKHKLERFAVAQLPYHPQYMDAGTSFNADLQRPLDFGTEALKPEALTAVGTLPPSGSVVHALLVTPLNSASSKKGSPVEAVISQPLFASENLVLPQGSRIKGSVVQVRPARRLGRNGQLRIVFRQVVPPSGIEEKVEASLEGVEVAKGEHLSLDSEGGAQVTTPRTRYLTTGIAVALATASTPGGDHDKPIHSGADPGAGAANGASGFRFVGTLIGVFAHSRVVTSGLGFYGAAMSVYTHFLARGRDVVYPKDMSMMVGLGTRDNGPASRAEPAPQSHQRLVGPL